MTAFKPPVKFNGGRGRGWGGSQRKHALYAVSVKVHFNMMTTIVIIIMQKHKQPSAL